MSSIIIQGIDSLPGSYFAARCLQTYRNRIFYFAEANHGDTEAEPAQSIGLTDANGTAAVDASLSDMASMAI